MRNQADHINTTDPAGNIKSLYEEEKDKQISFLDTLLVRQEDGSVKLLVYRKKSHTDTPIHLALQIIRERLEGDTELHTRTRVQDISIVSGL